MRRILGVLALALSMASGAGAQTPNPQPAEIPGSELTVYLMTMGQGDAVWERFGHNALGIRNEKTGEEGLYNWGMFDFAQPGFIPRFLQGYMVYSMANTPVLATIEHYRQANRTVQVAELALTPAQRLALLELVRINERPENAQYRYDYYRDNCSTRVRDALDRVLNGAIRTKFDTVLSGMSYRDHSLRLMQGAMGLWTGIDIGLGQPTDPPSTAWEEMFIPMVLRDYLRTLQVPDESGSMVSLVRSERTLVQATRVEEPARPASYLWQFLVAGLACAGILFSLGRGRGAARTAAVALATTWAALAGFLGVLLTLLWTITEHAAAYRNENLFQFNPLWLILAFLVPLALRRAHGHPGASKLAMICALLSVTGVAVQLLPWFYQDNGPILAFAVPMHLAVSALVLGNGVRAREMSA